MAKSAVAKSAVAKSAVARPGKGDRVSWAWGNGRGHGTVREVIERDVTREIEDSSITRHGSPENPALVIEQEDGGKVLKLASEVKRD